MAYFAAFGEIDNPGNQIGAAFEFYDLVRSTYPTAFISLTGHSLGGALAGVVGAVSGVTAYLYDQMPFHHAVNTIIEVASHAGELDAEGNPTHPTAGYFCRLGREFAFPKPAGPPMSKGMGNGPAASGVTFEKAVVAPVRMKQVCP